MFKKKTTDKDIDNHFETLVRIYWPPKMGSIFLNFIQGDLVR